MLRWLRLDCQFCKFSNVERSTQSPALKEVIEEIRKSLEGGVTLSKCFEKYPQHFDNVYINLIKAGEASGKLDIFPSKNCR